MKSPMLNVQPVLALLSNMRYTISDLSLDDVNNLLIALQEVPAKICNPLSEKVRSQVTAQISEEQAKAKEQLPENPAAE